MSPNRIIRLFPWGRLFAEDRIETVARIAEIRAKVPAAEMQAVRAQWCIDALDALDSAPALSATTVRRDSSCPVGAETLPGLHQRG